MFEEIVKEHLDISLVEILQRIFWAEIEKTCQDFCLARK